MTSISTTMSQVLSTNDDAVIKGSPTSSFCSTTHATEEDGTMESLSWSSSSDTHASLSSKRRMDLTVATDDSDMARIDLSKALVSPREKQILESRFDKILLNHFAPITNGSSSSSSTRRKHQLVVISGGKGSGKTVLSQCLSREVNRLFLYGKFSSLANKQKKMEPLSAFTSIIKQVVHILQSDDELRTSLQEKLKTEFANDEEDTKIALLRTFPDLHLLFPKQSMTPKRTSLSSLVVTANKHRFHNAVDRFFNILAQISPLVLVLDDIHLADIASMELFEFMMWEHSSTQQRSSMMVVACCAREELNDDDNNDFYHHQNASHLFSVLSQWHRQGSKNADFCAFELTEISLSTNATTVSLKSLTFEESKLAPLDLMVIKLAACLGVNPIPVNLLEIAFEALQISNGMTPKRSKLSTRSQELLEHLSRLETRGIFSWHSSNQQLIWANNSAEKSAQQLLLLQEEKEGFLDRLLRIVADGLVDAMADKDREYWIYFIADMYNTAGIIEEKENKTAYVSSLNLQAARRAMQSGSSHEACHYLSQAIDALRKAASTKRHHHQDLERTLHRLMVQIAACVDNQALLQASSNHLTMAGTMGMLEKLNIQQTQLGNMLKACTININPTKLAQQGANRCFLLLATEFAMKFPTKDFVQGVTISKGLMKLKSNAKSKHTTTDPLALLKLPTMTKPVQLAAMKLLVTCAHFCYIGGDARFPLVVLKSVELCQKYGRSIYSPLVYTLVGILMVVALDDCKTGVAYVNYASALLTRSLEPGAVQQSMESQAVGLSHFIVLPWSKPIANLLSPLKRAYEVGMHGGDAEAAIQAISNYIVLAFLSGKNLCILQQECSVYVTEMHRSKNLRREASCQIWWNIILELTGDTGLLGGDGAMDEEGIMQFILKTKDEDTLCTIHSAKAILYTMQGDHQRAADHAIANAEHIFKTIKKHPLLLFLPFYMGVSLFAAAKTSKKGVYKKYAKKMLTTAKEYHKKGNPNTLHHYMALEAESHALSGGRQHCCIAESRYKTAIDYSAKKGLLQDAALLSERYGMFLQAQTGKDEAGNQQLLKSKKWFKEWGMGCRK